MIVHPIPTPITHEYQPKEAGDRKRARMCFRHPSPREMQTYLCPYAKAVPKQSLERMNQGVCYRESVSFKMLIEIITRCWHAVE